MIASVGPLSTFLTQFQPRNPILTPGETRRERLFRNRERLLCMFCWIFVAGFRLASSGSDEVFGFQIQVESNIVNGLTPAKCLPNRWHMQAHSYFHSVVSIYMKNRN